jgi:cell division protein FtsB
MEEALKSIIADMVFQLAGIQAMLAKANARVAELEKQVSGLNDSNVAP